MKTFLQKHLDDLLILSGCGLIVYAVAQLLNPMAALAVAGVMLILCGVLVGMGAKE